MQHVQFQGAATARRFVPALTVILAIGGCGASNSTSIGAAPSAATPGAIDPPKKAAATACELITPTEMSAILNVAVVAQDNSHSGQSDCVYSAPSGFPTVELAIDWGNGESAMIALRMVNRSEPGIASPYAGIGDQAAAIGPALMIRTGDDLMKLIFSGVDDVPKKAKKIFDTAKARM